MKTVHAPTIALALFLAAGAAAFAQVDPTTTSNDTASTATTDSNPATADTSGSATDTSATTPSQNPVPAEGTESWLHHTFEIETLGWMLPLVAFIFSILIGLALHAVLVQHDVNGWPNTSGSWWKLRFPSLLLGVGLVITSYFLVIHDLDEELLRVAEPRAKLWTVVYLVLLLIFWLLPKPKVPTVSGRIQESA